MNSRKTILVTGASGFVGAQIIDHLLRAGFAVRGTTRSPKADELKKSRANSDFKIVIVDDIVKGDLGLKGVDGVIHVASPLSGKGDDIVEIAVEGTLNVLRQAYASKVYKATIVGSIAATVTSGMELWDGDRLISDKDWNMVTREDAEKPGNSPLSIYSGSKAISERAAWDFVQSHPEMDLTYILPAFIYGPLSRSQLVTDPNTMLGTNGWIYQLILGPIANYPESVAPQCVDIRDVARAAAISLKTKPSQAGEMRRILLWGGSFTWKDAVRHIAKIRPMLKSRLLDGGEPQPEEGKPSARVDLTKAKEILGMTDFIGWKKTVEDTVDCLLKMEGSWIS